MDSENSDVVSGPVELVKWIEDVSGLRVSHLDRLSGGGSREAWKVDVVAADGAERPLFLRRDMGGGPVSGSELTVGREARVCQALAKTDIPVSRVIAYDDERGLVLAELAPGGEAADIRKLSASPARQEIVDNYIDILARIHKLDPASLGLDELSMPTTPESHALLEVGLWRRLYQEKVTSPDPFLEAAFQWLGRNAPASVERTVLVHGDAGPGNFMYDSGRVTCIVDWEFAHFGDPMDDLAWIGFRHWVNGGIALPDLAGNLDRWSRESGLKVDPPRLVYYGLLVLTRVSVCCVRGLANASPSVSNAVWHELLPRMHEGIVHLLAHIAGIGLEPAPPAPVAPENAATLAVKTLSRELDHNIAPDLSSPTALQRAEGMRGLLDYLEAATRLDAALAASELRDLQALLGRAYSTPSDAAEDLVARIRETGPTDPDTLRYLGRRAGRDSAPWILGKARRATATPFPELYLVR